MHAHSFSESFDRVSEDRLSSSQSSKEAFLFDKSSDGQLDYNDTFTSGEKTPNSSILSPGNQTVKNTGIFFFLGGGGGGGGGGEGGWMDIGVHRIEK